MPIYEYKCEQCGAVTERLQKSMQDEEKPACSQCGSSKTSRILSRPFVSVKDDSSNQKATCCGRDTLCEIPPCTSDNVCQREL